ncbi:MAG: HAD family hydrolase [Anaerolineales bacterium]|nr:HAD family hydrolase [Anaerolineales bacterium]
MPLDTARVQAIFFDIDGTLADTDDAMVQRIARMLKPAAFLFKKRDPHPFARWAAMTAEGPANLFYGTTDRLGLDELTSPVVDWLHNLRGEGKPKHFLLIPGIMEMLDNLRSRYPLAVVTARDQRGAEAFIRQYDLEPYFKTVVTARTCRRSKPHPMPVLAAAEALGVPVEACLMVGDTTVDMRSGRAAGAQTVGVLCGFGTRDELVKHGADVILETTASLHEMLPE